MNNNINRPAVPFKHEVFDVPSGYAIVIDYEGKIVRDNDGKIIIARI